MRGIRALVACLLGLSPLGPVAAQSAQGGASFNPIFHTFLQRHFANLREAAPEASYQAAWVDLNRNGTLEVLVYMNGPIWCGPHGCDLFIFTPDRSSWRQVAEISVGRPPIRMLERRSNGWHDISLYVSTSLAPGDQSALSFDGQTYRPPAARPAPRPDEGRLLIGVEGPSTPLFARPRT